MSSVLWGTADHFGGVLSRTRAAIQVVAPISALGLVVPVLAGLLAGERPSVVQLVGIGVAVAGVILASGPEVSGVAALRPLLLAAAAGLGFGLTLLFLAQGGHPADSGDDAGRLRLTTGSGVRSSTSELPVLGFVGLADLGANGLTP